MQPIRLLKEKIKAYPIVMLVFVLLAYTRAIGFLPTFPTSLVYAIMLVYAIYSLSKVRYLSILFSLFLLYIPMNILVMAPSPIFQSWGRYGILVLLFLCVSPLLQSQKLRENRRKVFTLTLWLASLLSIGSFFCFFLGINFMYASNNTLITAGSFGGLCSQSMILGPLAAISTVFMAYKGYDTRKKIYWALMLACAGAVLFSASRSAVLSTLIGSVTMFYYITGGKGTFIKTTTGIIFIALITFPLWEGATDFVMQKQAANLQSGGAFYSREEKWGNRYQEFSSSPVFGVGFAAMDEKYTDDYNAQTGVMEPGSSWLGILSMTGLVGLGIMLVIFIQAMMSCKSWKNRENALLMGCLFLFATHMTVEGYVFSAGAFLCFLLWVVIGVSYDNLHTKHDYSLIIRS